MDNDSIKPNNQPELDRNQPPLNIEQNQTAFQNTTNQPLHNQVNSSNSPQVFTPENNTVVQPNQPTVINPTQQFASQPTQLNQAQQYPQQTSVNNTSPPTSANGSQNLGQPAAQQQPKQPFYGGSQGVQPGQPMSTPNMMQAPQTPPFDKKKKKWLLPVVFAAVLLVGGGAAAYVNFYLRSPEQLWANALKNTYSGLEKISEQVYETDPGFKMEGKFAVASPIAADGSMSGQWNGVNGSMTADIGAAGVRSNFEMRTIASNTETPDIYMKVSGLNGIGSLLESNLGVGAGELLNEVDNNWYFVDHTFIDQLAASASAESSMPQPTEEDYREFTTALLVPMKERLFSSDSESAVFTILEEIGREDFEGTGTYKLVVGVDKENLKGFVTATKDAIKDTNLVKTFFSEEGQSIDELLDTAELFKSIDDADFTDVKADVWVEGNGFFVRNVRFYPVDDNKDSNYLDFGLPYDGGDVLPLVMRATIDEDGVKGTLSLGTDINQENGDVRYWFDADIDGDMQIEADGELSIAGSDETVEIEKPTDAKNLIEFYNDLTSQFNTYQDSFYDDYYYGDDSFFDDSYYYGDELYNEPLFDDQQL